MTVAVTPGVECASLAVREPSHELGDPSGMAVLQLHRHSTIDHQGMARDELRLIGRQLQRPIRDVQGRSPPAQRIVHLLQSA